MPYSSEIMVNVSRFELPDRFDFNAARQLIRKIKAIPKSDLPATLRIDCRQTRYIDTAGLGSLLVIGDYIGANRTIRIESPGAQVGAILAMARIEERLVRRGSEAGEAMAYPRTGRKARSAEPERGVMPGIAHLAFV